ncbi:cytochrome P450 [Xylariaceae sp. FL0016]|nr:cytochrome P450 [Xylariaceae sp. FL0016]
MFGFILQEYPEIADQGILYMDPWPIGFPMIVVYHPAMNAQFTQENSLHKFWAQGHKEFKHFTNGEDLVHLEGQQWKRARAMFNPGFSVQNLLSLVPQFVEEAMVFRERLRKAAISGEVVKLGDLAIGVTIDIVGRAVLGTRLRTQSQPNRLTSVLQAQISLVTLILDLSKALSPTRHLKHWYYNRTIRKELMPYIRDTIFNYEKIEGPKTIIALAFKSHMSETSDQSARGHISPAFLDWVIKNIKIFMFAGHDTTAIALAYCYWVLSENPDKLAKVRVEHDEVLGPDPTSAASLISADPTLLNKLPYTGAVLKETLRLFPPIGGTIRQSPPGHYLTHPETGQRYPTHGFMIHSSGSTLHRLPRYWPDATSFIPERFLVRDENDPLHPYKNVWRTFELGPRGCIGQELVNLEIRLILALAVREFDIKDAYADDAETFLVIKAYQNQTPEHSATAHIKDALPVTIRARG